MERIKRILVVSRDIGYSHAAVDAGIFLCRQYGAELYIIHVIHDPFSVEGWSLPFPSFEEEYKRVKKETKERIDKLVFAERNKGLPITELIEEGDPTREVLKAVKENGIDLLVMLAHEEGRLEHFLFGRSNEQIIRKMPCSVLLVKQEAKPVRF